MKKIDYDAYLAGLGDFETNQKNIIKKYLDEQAEKDEALKTLYRPEKIDECYDFIKECVHKKATGNSACVEDAIVFKMARDFFIEILPKADDEGLSTLDEIIPKVKEEETPEEKAADVEKVKETVADVAGQIEEDAEQEPAEEKLEINKIEQLEEQFAELKKALSFGKTIQIKQNGEWVDLENPCHLEGDKEYRIKPDEEQPEEKPAEPEQTDEVQYDENGNGMLFSF